MAINKLYFYCLRFASSLSKPSLVNMLYLKGLSGYVIVNSDLLMLADLKSAIFLSQASLIASASHFTALVQPKPMPGKQKKRKKVKIPSKVLETAVYQCEKFLATKDHDDIDVPKEVGELTDQQWDDLIQWYYQLVQ